jgi:hypothetical protein
VLESKKMKKKKTQKCKHDKTCMLYILYSMWYLSIIWILESLAVAFPAIDIAFPFSVGFLLLKFSSKLYSEVFGTGMNCENDFTRWKGAKLSGKNWKNCYLDTMILLFWQPSSWLGYIVLSC